MVIAPVRFYVIPLRIIATIILFTMCVTLVSYVWSPLIVLQHVLDGRPCPRGGTLLQVPFYPDFVHPRHNPLREHSRPNNTTLS